MGTDIDRKLATLQKIIALDPIEGAERIEVASVLGWKCVVKKGEFNVGDLAIYCEIDSFLPVKPEYEFLRTSSFKKLSDGREGFRLKTIKLKGQISQGLILPWEILPSKEDANNPYIEGDDVTAELGITKWEPPENSAIISGNQKGLFPSFIRKTDQERVQGLKNKEKAPWIESTFEESIKLDGTSATYYVKDGEFGYCSRNFEQKDEDGEKETVYREMMKKYGIKELLKSLNRNVALQGEIIGEGIQKNPEKMVGREFRVFDIFDIDKGAYMLPKERRSFLEMLNATAEHPLLHVPVMSESATPLKQTTDELLAHAEGPSLNPQVSREGIVYKCNDSSFSFKVISNKYLLGHDS